MASRRSRAAHGAPILGDPDQATIRAGYARAFIREGLNRFGMPYEVNPGASFDAVRNVTNGNLVLPGDTWPLLFRETNRLGPGAVPSGPTYPLPISRTAGVNLFDPDWEVGLADSFSAGIQRGISRDMAIEVRYVGTRGRNLVEIEDWNEINLIENGFLDEFKLAQANLAANIAAGAGPDDRVRRHGHRDVAAADLPGVFHRFAKRRRSAGVYGPELEQRDDCRTLRAVESESRRLGERSPRRCRLPRQRRSRPVSRRTTSCSIRTSAPSTST